MKILYNCSTKASTPQILTEGLEGEDGDCTHREIQAFLIVIIIHSIIQSFIFFSFLSLPSSLPNILLTIHRCQVLQLLQIHCFQTIRNLPSMEIRPIQLLNFMKCIHPGFAVFCAIHNQTRPFLFEGSHTKSPAAILVDNAFQLVIAAFVEEYVALAL